MSIKDLIESISNIKTFISILLDIIKYLSNRFVFLSSRQKIIFAVIISLFVASNFVLFELIGRDLSQKYFYFFVGESLLLCIAFGLATYSELKKSLSLYSGLFCMLISLFFIGFTYIQWSNWLSSPPKEIIIQVADFENGEELSSMLIDQLRQATNSHKNIKIQPLNKILTAKEGSEKVRDIGEKRKATILIWGAQSPSIGEDGLYTIHFEILRSLKTSFGSREPRKNGIQISNLRELKFKHNPNAEFNYLTNFTIGLAQLTKDDWKASIGSFTSALVPLKKKPDLVPYLYFYRGISYLFDKNLEEAITDFTQVTKLNESIIITKSHVNIGNAYYFKRDYNKALAAYGKAIDIDPQTFSAYYNRGVIYGISKKREAAIIEFSQAIHLNPKYVIAYYNRGFANAELNHKQEALEDYNEAIRLEPKYPMAYFEGGNVLNEMGDKKKAIWNYSQAIRLDQSYTEAYNNRGILRAELGDEQGAIQDYNNAIQLDPNYAEAYNNRGILRAELGCKQEAIQDYDQAIRLNPNYDVAYNNRGYTRAKLDDWQGAVQDFNQAIRLNPNFAKAYGNRGEARIKLGDKEGAGDIKKANNLAKKPS
jgi:tetratricopeptide (TPR) repeat protein